MNLLAIEPFEPFSKQSQNLGVGPAAYVYEALQVILIQSEECHCTVSAMLLEIPTGFKKSETGGGGGSLAG